MEDPSSGAAGAVTALKPTAPSTAAHGRATYQRRRKARRPSRYPGDAAFQEIFHPIAELLLARCDAVLRIGGPSDGADRMVARARDQGLDVYTRIDDVPSAR
ncbi:hypothetical protein [Streptomyces sp. NPDC048496]|uniref:hypothetical protein n=1 Tax=Streptomyces sp. NPDC048496 TaxID=3365558 RepID=UPI003710FD27